MAREKKPVHKVIMTEGKLFQEYDMVNCKLNLNNHNQETHSLA